MTRKARTSGLFVFIFAIAILFFGVVPARAQSNINEEQGLKPYDALHGGDLDSVSLTNGGLTLHIPLASFPQRGNLELSFFVLSGGKQWKVFTPHNLPSRWMPVGNLGAQVVSSMDWRLLDGGGGPDMPDMTLAAASPDGNVHQFGQGVSTCVGLYSLDATGMLRPDCGTLITPGGTRYTFGTLTEGDGGSQAATATDANGNRITISASGWTDTIGRVIPGSSQSGFAVQPGVPTSDLSTCPSGTSSAMVWNVPGPAGVNGGVRTFKFCYSPVTISTNFQTGQIEFGPASTALLTAVVLPDLTTWTFAYDNYANVTRVGFPTGGSLSYQYIFNARTPRCANKTPGSMEVTSRTVDANDGSGGHTWHYSYSTGKATVTSPEGNDTVHTLADPVSGGVCALYETQTQSYQGSAGAGTLLKTISTAYSGAASPFGPYDINVVPTSVTQTLPSGLSSHVVNTYDAGVTNGDGEHVIFGSLLQKDEYDFSGSAPVRSTLTHYLWQDNPTYLTNNFLSLVASTTVTDGAGNHQMAQSTFGYDGTQVAGSGVTTQLVPPPAGGNIRGNQTTASRWLNPGNTLVSATATYFDTGMKASSTDPLLNQTSYIYSTTFKGAYMTETDLPDTLMPDTGATIVHHKITGNYDLNTGLLTSFTDENNKSFSYQYDIMLRLAQGNHPDGGQTTFSYPDTLTVNRQRLISASPSAVWDSYTAKFDGLGRSIQAQQVTPSGTALTDTTYDVMGRTSTVSNPYYQGSVHGGDPTYGTTQSQYDALNRVIKTIKQDGSFRTAVYNQPAALLSLADCTISTDESGRQRRTCSDALGRLVEVDEPNPAASSTAATGSVSIGGSEQTATTTTIVVANPGFEAPAVGAGNFQYNPVGGSWTFSGAAGISSNGSAFTSGNPAAPEGTQVALLQNGSASVISQSLSGFQTGVVYTVGFFAAQRGNSNQVGQDFGVYLDNTLLGTFRPAGTGWVAMSTAAFSTTAGAHTLKFVGIDSSGGDNTAFIDAVRVTGAAGLLVAGSGFEAPVLGSGASAYQYHPAGSSWTFGPNSGLDGTGAVVGGSGISGNNSGFTSSNPPAPEGAQVAFLQGGPANFISQSISGFQAGVSYSVSFQAAQRGSSNAPAGQDFDVYIDQTLLGTFRPAGSSYALLTTPAFTTTAGAHTLKFVGRDSAGGNGDTVFLDAVQVTGTAGFADTGTVSVTINGTPYSTSYGSGDTAGAIAGRLATGINAGSVATAVASGALVNLTSKTAGSAGNFTLAAAYTWNTSLFTNPSFTSSPSGATLTGGMDPGNLNNNSYVTLYTYDTLNNLLCVEQHGAATGTGCSSNPTLDATSAWRVRRFTYDSMSRLLTANNRESGTLIYAYDNNGNVTSKTEPKPNVPWGSAAQTVIVSYTYDALNRLLNVTYSDGTTQNASYRYDYLSFLGQTFTNPIGRQVSATAAGNTIKTFTSYDVMGRVTQTVECISGVTNCNTSTASYDLLGDLLNLGYPGSTFAVTYQHDSAARLIKATDSSGNVYAQTPTILASGAMQEFVSPNFNNYKFHTDYNSRLQPVEIWAGSAQGVSALFDKTYQYNPTGLTQVNNGNIYTVTNVKDDTRTQSFGYDALNRLLQAGDKTHWGNSYVYDPWGNLLQKNPGAPSGETLLKTADVNNHLSGLTYDEAGNTTNDGFNGYTFDGENRITAVGASVSYTYDTGGRRVRKTVSSAITNYWYGPGGQVLTETDGSGATTNYVFFGGQRLARNISGDIKYYITDHLHSTAVVADKSGVVIDDNDFYPWGGVVQGVGVTASTNHYKFTGKERDGESQLDDLGARYYSNIIGRFMSPDWAEKPTAVPYAELADPQSLNLYSYVRNSPIIRVDVDGHDANSLNWRRNGGPTSAAASSMVGDPPGPPTQSGDGISDEQRQEMAQVLDRGKKEIQNAIENWHTRPPPRICGQACSAQMKYRPTGGRPGDQNHSFWYLRDRNGRTFNISAGKPPNSKYLQVVIYEVSTLDPSKSPYQDFPSSTTWFEGSASDICGCIDKMVEFALHWPQTKVIYDARGPNSNSIANAVGKAAGFNVPEPPNVLGWFTPLF